MNLIFRFIPLLIALTLAACGGGGGGSSGGGDTNAGQFTLQTKSVSATGTQGAGASAMVSATGSVIGASGTVYIYIDLTASKLVASANVRVDGITGSLELWGVNPDKLTLGHHSEEIPIKVCADTDCKRHLGGSPATLTFNYTILPNPAITDSDGDGVFDQVDIFPNNAGETKDFDKDTIGDNADPDDDNDGVKDTQDDYPLDYTIASTSTKLHFSIAGQGSVSVDDVNVDCSTDCSAAHTNLNDGFTIIKVTPAAHYSIGNWAEKLNCHSVSANTCEIHTSYLKELNVDLHFVEDPYATVVINSAQGGVVEKLGQLDCHGHCELKAYTNTSVNFTFKPVPAPGAIFDGWSGVCNGMADCVINVNAGASISLNANFVDSGLSADLCAGTAVTSGQGTDLPGTIGRYLPLCHGQALLADTQLNKIIWRDLVNQTTIHEYQLSAVPRYLALDEENKLLYVTHGTASKISRIDLATGEVQEIFIAGGADSLAISPTNDLFVRSYPMQLLDSRYATSLPSPAITIEGENITYNDATNRLITSTQNYFFDSATKSFTLQGRSNAGGSGSDCNYVVVSPDGEHGAMPCGAGNGDGYTIFDFSSHNPSVKYGEWNTGNYPSGAAFSPSNHYAWLTNRTTLQLFSVDNHTLLETYPSPGCSYGDTRGLAISTDGNLLLALTDCGFANDAAVLSWIYYDTNTAP